MRYPTDLTSFKTLLLEYAAPEDSDVETATEGARQARSPVVACVIVFKAFRAAPDLDEGGLRLLVTAAHLIAAGGWHGLAGDAAVVLAERAAELPEMGPTP